MPRPLFAPEPTTGLAHALLELRLDPSPRPDASGEPYNFDRAAAIKRIKVALQARSGKEWSVTGHRGTAFGWLTIDAPPKRRTWHWVNTGQRDERTFDPIYAEVHDPARDGGHTSPLERAELAALLGLDTPIHYQGQSIPSGYDHYREYIDRAEGRAPSVFGSRDWD